MKVNVPHRTQYIVVFLKGKHKMLGIRMLHKNEYLLVSGFSRRRKNTNILEQTHMIAWVFKKYSYNQEKSGILGYFLLSQSIDCLSLIFFRPKKREDFYIFPLGVRLLLTY